MVWALIYQQLLENLPIDSAGKHRFQIFQNVNLVRTSLNLRINARGSVSDLHACVGFRREKNCKTLTYK